MRQESRSSRFRSRRRCRRCRRCCSRRRRRCRSSRRGRFNWSFTPPAAVAAAPPAAVAAPRTAGAPEIVASEVVRSQRLRHRSNSNSSGSSSSRRSSGRGRCQRIWLLRLLLVRRRRVRVGQPVVRVGHRGVALLEDEGRLQLAQLRRLRVQVRAARRTLVSTGQHKNRGAHGRAVKRGSTAGAAQQGQHSRGRGGSAAYRSLLATPSF